MKSERFAHIDAMRAIAVLLVVWTHTAENFAGVSGSQHFLDSLQDSVNFGRIGVVIFFAISGMLIPSSLKGSLGEGTRSFIIRRFFRLFPAFWVSILVYWLMIPGRSVADVVANATMLPGLFGREPLTGLYWTLETELYFYFACLFVFWSGMLHRIGALSLLTVFFSVAFIAISALHLLPEGVSGPHKALPLHLAIMFWGATFRKAWDEGRYTSLSFLSATVAVVLSSSAILAYGLKNIDPKQISNGLAYLFALVLFATFATRIRITLRPIAWVGRISYSIYLLHPAAFSAVPIILTIGAPLSLYLLVAVCASVAVAWVSYILVEVPSIKMGAALSPATTS